MHSAYYAITGIVLKLLNW